MKRLTRRERWSRFREAVYYTLSSPTQNPHEHLKPTLPRDAPLVPLPLPVVRSPLVPTMLGPLVKAQLVAFLTKKVRRVLPIRSPQC